jgi:hypothetical protein
VGLLVDYEALGGSAQTLGNAGDMDAAATNSVNSVAGSGGACDPIAAGAYEHMANVWIAQLGFLSQAVTNFGSGTSSAAASYQEGDTRGAGAYPR